MKITVPGILIFLALVVGFFLWFGGPQKLPEDSILSQRRVTKAWIYCSALFVAGAGTACFADKEYGMFPPTSLRWLFIIFGALIMAAAAAWMHSLRTAAYDDSARYSPPRTPIYATGNGGVWLLRMTWSNKRSLMTTPAHKPPTSPQTA